MTTNALVSVVIPAFNTRDCVEVAIDSALAQVDASVEVIVVDDASTDGTADLVAQHYAGDDRVRVIRSERNSGPSAARNIGFRAARGVWIALLDSDDHWKPNRLARLLRHADHADFIADNILSYDVVSDLETGPIYHDIGDRELHLIDFIAPKAADVHDFGYLQPLLRRDFLVAHAISYRENVRVGEDLLLNLEFLAAGGRAYYVDEPLYVYATPVGLVSRVASPHSRSTTRTEPLICALRELRQRLSAQLSEAEDEAFEARIEVLQRDAAVAAFHRARAKSNLVEMTGLFLMHSSVRDRAYERIVGLFMLGRSKP